MPLSDSDGSKARPEDPPSTGVASTPPISFAATANAEPTFSVSRVLFARVLFRTDLLNIK